VSERKSYRLLVKCDYPSNKDGKRRINPAGTVVDDLPPSDIKHLVAQGYIEPADEPVEAEPAEDVPVTEVSEGTEQGQESEG